jgi:GNAT superfamily N-acetyltransferase
VDALREGGATKLITGQDRRHFFPGIPENLPRAFEFFGSQGWTRSDGFAADMWRDITDFVMAPNIQQKLQELAASGIVIRPCSREDVPALLEHVGHNFSPRWLAETQSRVAVEPTPAEILIAARADGSVVGFCHTFSNRSAAIGPSIYWREILGPHYGGLGPIGVAADVRKMGLGIGLCAVAVITVRDGGALRMAIAWTVLTDFYAKLGFTVWRKYYPATIE